MKEGGGEDNSYELGRRPASRPKTFTLSDRKNLYPPNEERGGKKKLRGSVELSQRGEAREGGRKRGEEGIWGGGKKT